VAKTTKRDPVRVWASVLIDGRLRCDVRDVETAIVGADDQPGVYRPFCYEVVSPGQKLEACSVCVPGRACPACHRRAARYWVTAHKRDNERQWRAVVDSWPRANGWSAKDYGPVRMTPAEAERDAKAKGWKRFACFDGHHRVIEIRDVEGS
jgi:hypothetical protein